jgi:hypothetical protein
MERSGEFTPHLPPTLRYGATSNPFPSEGRGEERAATTFMNKSSPVSPLLLEKRRGEGEELSAI